MRLLQPHMRHGRTVAQPDYPAQAWLHSALLTVALIATIAVGVAGTAAITGSANIDATDATTAIGANVTTDKKTDRLPAVGAADSNYRVVETRGDGLSVLELVPLAAD